MHRISGFMSTIILTGLVALFLVSSVCAEGGYSFLTTWGTSGSGNGQFDYPHGIAIDDEGNVYVADAYNDRIQKFDANGAFITKWGTSGSGNGQFDWPGGSAIDNLDNQEDLTSYMEFVNRIKAGELVQSIFFTMIMRNRAKLGSRNKQINDWAARNYQLLG